MPPVKIQLDKHYKGDSWTGMIVGPVMINALQPTNALASVRLQFRNVKTGDLGYEFTSDNTAVDTPTVGKGFITIDDTLTWQITLSPQLLDIPDGRWDWDFECTDTTGYRITLYRGTMAVTGDITYG